MGRKANANTERLTQTPHGTTMPPPKPDFNKPQNIKRDVIVIVWEDTSASNLHPTNRTSKDDVQQIRRQQIQGFLMLRRSVSAESKPVTISRGGIHKHVYILFSVLWGEDGGHGDQSYGQTHRIISLGRLGLPKFFASSWLRKRMRDLMRFISLSCFPIRLTASRSSACLIHSPSRLELLLFDITTPQISSASSNWSPIMVSTVLNHAVSSFCVVSSDEMR